MVKQPWNKQATLEYLKEYLNKFSINSSYRGQKKISETQWFFFPAIYLFRGPPCPNTQCNVYYLPTNLPYKLSIHVGKS